MTPTDAVERLNPSSWNLALGYDQAQLRPAPSRLLTLAGQGAILADGTPVHAGDMAGQLTVALDNVEELLGLAGMDWNDVFSVTTYVTDIDAALAAYPVVTSRLAPSGATPPGTLVEVTRLAVPTMLVEITVQAGR